MWLVYVCALKLCLKLNHGWYRIATMIGSRSNSGEEMKKGTLHYSLSPYLRGEKERITDVRYRVKADVL